MHMYGYCCICIYVLYHIIKSSKCVALLPPALGSAARPLHRCSPTASRALPRKGAPPWPPSSSAQSTTRKAQRAGVAWGARAHPSASPSPAQTPQQLALVAPGGDLAAIGADLKIKIDLEMQDSIDSTSKTLIALGVFSHLFCGRNGSRQCKSMQRMPQNHLQQQLTNKIRPQSQVVQSCICKSLERIQAPPSPPRSLFFG